MPSRSDFNEVVRRSREQHTSLRRVRRMPLTDQTVYRDQMSGESRILNNRDIAASGPRIAWHLQDPQ